MTTDPFYPPPPYTPSDPLTPTSTQAPESPLGFRGGDGAIPPYSPSTLNSDQQQTPSLDQSDALPHFSSAASYFERREPRTLPPANVFPHQLYISPNDRAEDIAQIPLCWRDRSNDLTRADMDTFANYLLPPNTSRRLPAKLRTDLSRDEKEPMSPTDSETEAEKRSRMSLVVGEWNEGFFYPRGLQIELGLVNDRPAHAARGLAPTCETCVAVNNANSRYLSTARLQQPQSAPYLDPGMSSSQRPLSQQLQPTGERNPFGILRAGVERIAGAYIRAGVDHQSRDCYSGRGRRRERGNRHHHGRSASSSSSSSDDSHHGRRGGRGLGRGHGHGRHGGFGGRHSLHHHGGRRGRSSSTSSSSSSSSSSSDSSFDSISSHETRGLGLEDLRRSIAAVRIQKEGQKFEAKMAMKELKRDLKGMKKDMERGGRGKKGIDKEEKRAVKQELKGMNKEFRDSIREFKKEKKGLKREAREQRRVSKREDRDRRRERDGGQCLQKRRSNYGRRGEAEESLPSVRAEDGHLEGQVSGVTNIDRHGYPKDMKV